MHYLDDSSQILGKTTNAYKDELGQAVSRGDQALTRLQQRERTDNILLFLGASFFFSVVLYILKERLWG